MKRKGVSVGTRILIAIIVMVSGSIAVINLLTIFGIIEAPDLYAYTGIISIFLLPFLIIAATVNKILSEQKEAVEDMMQKPQEIGRKIELKINFKAHETTIADTSSHPAFYAKIAIASMMSVSTGIFTLLIMTEGLITKDFLSILPMLIPLIGIVALIHLFSKHLFEPHGWREFLEHAWIALLIIGISISVMMFLRGYILKTYPRKFWESFLGLPFSLPAIMSLILLLLIGGILIRIGDFIRLETSPLKASGITLVLTSVIFIVPQFNFIDWELLLIIISNIFSLTLIGYGIAAAALLYKDSGMRYLITNDRIIKMNTHRIEKSSYYPLSRLKKVGVEQDFLAERFGYGNVVAFFSARTSRGKKRPYCILHGVKNPSLISNAIEAVAGKKKKVKKKKVKRKKVQKKVKKKPIKKKPKKKKPIKKKPIKKKPIKKKKPKKKSKKKKKKSDDFYYKMIIPVLLILSLSLILPSGLYGASAQGFEGDITSTQGERIVEEYEIRYSKASEFNITGRFNIYSYNIEGALFNASQMRVFYHSSAENRAIIVGELLSEADKQINRLLNQSYGLLPNTTKADISTETMIVESSFDEDLSPDEPVQVIGTAEIELKPPYFDLPKKADLDEIAFGLLKVGGYIEQDIYLGCEDGHDTIYHFFAPSDITFQDEKKELYWRINNTEGANAKVINESISIFHRDPLQLSKSDLKADLMIDIYDLVRTTEREYVKIDLNFSASLKVIPVPEYLNTTLPGSFNIDFVNSALLRLLYQNGMDDMIGDYIAELEDEMSARISEFSDTPVSSELELKNFEKNYSTEKMSSKPPVQIIYNTSIEKTIAEFKQKKALSSFKTRYTYSEKVKVPIRGFKKWPLNYTVKIPEGLRLMEAKAGGESVSPERDPLTGRYMVSHHIDPGEEEELKLEIGSVVDLTTFFPFVIAIVILFIVWLGLNLYPVKEKHRTRIR